LIAIEAEIAGSGGCFFLAAGAGDQSVEGVTENAVQSFSGTMLSRDLSEGAGASWDLVEDHQEISSGLAARGAWDHIGDHREMSNLASEPAP
jgi:hypothetical protein